MRYRPRDSADPAPLPRRRGDRYAVRAALAPAVHATPRSAAHCTSLLSLDADGAPTPYKCTVSVLCDGPPPPRPLLRCGTALDV